MRRATPPPRWPGWAAADEPLRLAFARDVAAAKLHNFATIAVRFGFEGAADTAAAIRDLELSEFERRLQTTFTPEGAAGPVAYLEFLYRQARAMTDLVRRRVALYSPLRAHT